DVCEMNARRDFEAFRMGREVRVELGVARRPRSATQVFREEKNLLDHALADDGVFAVEAETNPLAVEDLVFDRTGVDLFAFFGGKARHAFARRLRTFERVERGRVDVQVSS